MWLKNWRRKRIAQKHFPDNWLWIIRQNVPYYRQLSIEDQKELQQHILIFLHEKRFEGCRGLLITEEIKLTIAAQACILLLHRQTDYYPGLSAIIVYPSAFIVNRMEHLPGGVIAEVPQVHLGESWHQGTVILSWDDVKHDSADVKDGHNVVFHEFAHQIDASEGRGDNTEVLKDHSSYMAWARVLRQDYEKLKQAAAQNQDSFLDEYGATNPAEFFAVATEYFFERSVQLRQLHPDLYEELKRFYQQDPAQN